MKAYRFKINGNAYDVQINSVEGKNADVTVNGISYSVELEKEAPAAAPAAPVAAAPAAVQAPAQATPAPAAKPAGAATKSVTSPLPGVIIEVSVKEGQAVKAGQKVAVLEAMKMENDIEALEDGVVAEIKVAKGDSVPEGAVIVTMA